MNKKIVAIAMSGGVDSSVVAAIMQKQYSNVFGITMNIHKHCERAISDAAIICAKLDIPHFVVDLQNEFKKNVVDVFKKFYENGLTPNPCALCNRDIKMGILLSRAIDLGADAMATGHYVRNIKSPLHEALDKTRDQSYFLSLVKRTSLEKMLFPLGDINSKNETRDIAKQFDLHTFDKKDSQDICFIPKNNYKIIFNDTEQQNHGEIRHIESNKLLGFHMGIRNYTIGQRKGLMVSYRVPLYIIRIDAQSNTIFVGESNYLNKNNFTLYDVNWIHSQDDDCKTFQVYVKLRSSCKKIRAEASATNNEHREIAIHLLEDNDTPVTNGQICTMYDNDENVIGGGIIQS